MVSLREKNLSRRRDECGKINLSGVHYNFVIIESERKQGQQWIKLCALWFLVGKKRNLDDCCQYNFYVKLLIASNSTRIAGTHNAMERRESYLCKYFNKLTDFTLKSLECEYCCLGGMQSYHDVPEHEKPSRQWREQKEGYNHGVRSCTGLCHQLILF